MRGGAHGQTGKRAFDRTPRPSIRLPPLGTAPPLLALSARGRAGAEATAGSCHAGALPRPTVGALVAEINRGSIYQTPHPAPPPSKPPPARKKAAASSRSAASKASHPQSEEADSPSGWGWAGRKRPPSSSRASTAPTPTPGPPGPPGPRAWAAAARDTARSRCPRRSAKVSSMRRGNRATRSRGRHPVFPPPAPPSAARGPSQTAVGAAARPGPRSAAHARLPNVDVGAGGQGKFAPASKQQRTTVSAPSISR